MKYKRGDQLIYNKSIVEIVDRDPHSKGYLVITLEHKGQVGGIQDLIIPEYADKIEIKATNNPFATKKHASETPSLVRDFAQYESMMNL